MANLYKVKYTQESEAFVQAESEEKALEFITMLTENGGGDKMSSVRLNECGWFIEADLGELVELDKFGIQAEARDEGYTHKTKTDCGCIRMYSEGDYGLLYDL